MCTYTKGMLISLTKIIIINVLLKKHCEIGTMHFDNVLALNGIRVVIEIFLFLGGLVFPPVV